jgi:predicted DNA-binding transcriptional regulator AlpA
MDFNQKSITPQFSSLPNISEQTQMGKSTILAWEALGKFPKAVRLSRNKRVWLQSDIDSWMIEQKDKSSIKAESIKVAEVK